MLARVSSSELTEWQAYERVHGPLDRGDWHAAQVAQAIHSQWVKKTKPLGDYVIEWDQGPDTPESLAEKFKDWARSFGG